MGEVIAFLILLMGMDSDKDTADLIFNLVAGGVLVVGLLVSVFMVKDKKVRRKYSKKVDGSWFLNKKKIEYDEDENDTSGEEEDLDGVGEGAMLLKAEKMAKCERSKLVWKQVGLAVKNDRLNWLVFYASFVNQMMKEELGTII